MNTTLIGFGRPYAHREHPSPGDLFYTSYGSAWLLALCVGGNALVLARSGDEPPPMSLLDLMHLDGGYVRVEGKLAWRPALGANPVGGARFTTNALVVCPSGAVLLTCEQNAMGMHQALTIDVATGEPGGNPERGARFHTAFDLVRLDAHSEPGEVLASIRPEAEA